MEADLRKVWQLYGKIVNIEEYFRPSFGWSSILPDGTDLRNQDIYYELEPGATSSHQIIPNIRERLVIKCVEAGATVIQFKCKESDNKDYAFPDYKIEELII